ncbi:hypothetical protein OPV22_031961 [Ensete ventricosum]|uniref:Uncharacterized protein n=1 Tax=Ensete ventricosum TaxID=4639 RepID=A0AAV8PNK2_ENSVE|nr:hypothetical protein OPV22_031961 [Ensete ventricosum]
MELFLLPTPAADHLTSTVEMASRLLDRVGGGGLSVTVLVMTTPAPCLRFETESCILLHRRRRPVRGAPGAATRAVLRGVRPGRRVLFPLRRAAQAAPQGRRHLEAARLSCRRARHRLLRHDDDRRGH